MRKPSISVEKQEWNLEPDVAALENAATFDHAGAEIAYKALASKGSALSMANLGYRYEYRRPEDGGPDFSQAELWYRKAIDSGSAVATVPFGYFYLRRKDYVKAYEVFSIGMQRGYAPAIVRLADLYLKGIGVERDYSHARALLGQADKLGNLWAKRSLARMDINIGTNPLVKTRGYVMRCVADVLFYLEKKRNPTSERLKK